MDIFAEFDKHRRPEDDEIAAAGADAGAVGAGDDDKKPATGSAASAV